MFYDDDQHHIPDSREQGSNMRITREKKQENHDRIVAIASEMFRERGFGGVGVSDLMERSGLTHGGFYNHFASKEVLIAEAAAKGFDDTATRYKGVDIGTMIDAYVSRTHRDARALGCPAAALSGEAARLPDETRTVFGDGIEALLVALQKSIAATGHDRENTRSQAICVLAQAVGAIVLSRACPDTSGLADEILEVIRADCHAIVAAG